MLRTTPAHCPERDDQVRAEAAAWARGARRCALAAALLAAPAAAWAQSFECLIQPTETVALRSPEEGLIERINVHRGDAVKAGEALVELESSAQRSAVAAAKYQAEMTGKVSAASAQLDASNKNLERMRKLQREHFIAAQKRDDADAQMLIAQAQLHEAKEGQQLAQLEYRHELDLLKLRTLRSPFDGVVVDRVLEPGDLAENGTDTKPILRLAKINPLRVEVILPAKLYGGVRRGMTGVVTPDDVGGSYRATVTSVDRVFDAASATFGVRMELPNPKGAVPGGIRCHVELPGLRDTPSRPAD